VLERSVYRRGDGAWQRVYQRAAHEPPLVGIQGNRVRDARGEECRIYQ
jgi:hypothetical protein